MEDKGLHLFILCLSLNNLWPAELLRNLILAVSVFHLSLPFDVQFAQLHITAGTAIILCNFSCAVFCTFNFSILWKVLQSSQAHCSNVDTICTPVEDITP